MSGHITNVVACSTERNISIVEHSYPAIILIKPKANATWFFVVQAVGRIISGREFSKIIIILSFRVGVSINEKIDHRVNKTCAIM